MRLPPGQVRVPRSDELRALVLQHGADRGGACGDHELAEVSADQVSERELRDRFYFLELLLPGSVLHGGPSGKRPENSLGVGWTATSIFNRDRDYASERDAFAKLVPADYKISKHCIKTDRHYAWELEEAWLSGLTAIKSWDLVIDKLVRYKPGTARMASWDGTGFVTQSDRGLCMEPFDPAVAQAVFDHEGSCWAGSPTDILLAPRVEFPTGKYTQVSTQAGRTCAVTTTGSLTCCGRNDTKFGTPPKTALRQVTLGDEFACGLDAAGNATCWGSVKTAPTGVFTKLVAGHYRVCGIHRDGSVECWPDAPSPKGTFIDIALDSGACGVRSNGTIECWDRAPSDDPVPSHWQAVAIGGNTLCGLRHDQSVGCTQANHLDEGKPMTTPVPHTWTQIAVAERFGACGIRADATIGCSDLQPAWLGARTVPPPKGAFTHIAASQWQFCAVGSAGTVSCWGDPWPKAPPPPVKPATAVRGTIVDENGTPIANATVEIEENRSTPPLISKSAADGTWKSSTKQHTLWAKFTAPGREVVSLYGDQNAFDRPVVLRPASTITVEATCDGRPCPAEVQRGGYIHPPKFEHIAPGSYRMLVWKDHGTEHERLAIVEVEMLFAAKPQVVKVALKETGSGHSIRGSVWTKKMSSIEGQRVDLRCANETLRRVETDKRGTFELKNVPPLPCTLEASGIELNSSAITITSHAIVMVELH